MPLKEGQVVRCDKNGTIYLIQNNRKRPFPVNVFNQLGRPKFQFVKCKELDSYKLGAPMTAPNIRPASPVKAAGVVKAAPVRKVAPQRPSASTQTATTRSTVSSRSSSGSVSTRSTTSSTASSRKPASRPVVRRAAAVVRRQAVAPVRVAARKPPLKKLAPPARRLVKSTKPIVVRPVAAQRLKVVKPMSKPVIKRVLRQTRVVKPIVKKVIRVVRPIQKKVIQQVKVLKPITKRVVRPIKRVVRAPQPKRILRKVQRVGSVQPRLLARKLAPQPIRRRRTVGQGSGSWGRGGNRAGRDVSNISLSNLRDLGYFLYRPTIMIKNKKRKPHKQHMGRRRRGGGQMNPMCAPVMAHQMMYPNYYCGQQLTNVRGRRW